MTAQLRKQMFLIASVGLALFCAGTAVAGPVTFYDLSVTTEEDAFNLSVTSLTGTTIGLDVYDGTTGELTLDDGRSVLLSDNTSPDFIPSIYDDITPDYSWWPDDENGKFIGTYSNTIVLDFEEDFYVSAITFDLGVSFNAGLWFGATLTDPDASYYQSQTYGVAATSNSLGLHSYGMVLSNGTGDSCRAMSSVIIDPDHLPTWGIANIQIYEDTSCTSVPEPGSLSLLGAGLLGLGLLRHNRRKRTRYSL